MIKHLLNTHVCMCDILGIWNSDLNKALPSWCFESKGEGSSVSDSSHGQGTTSTTTIKTGFHIFNIRKKLKNV